MKKIILSAIVALSALAADAQVWAGGSISFGVKDYDATDKSQISYEISPEIGYSLNEKWDVAIALSADITNNVLGVADKDLTIYSINPYARYTFATTGIASFFVEGGFTFGSAKESHSDAKTSFSIGVRPGVKIALSDKVSLVSKLGFLEYETVKDTYNNFGFSFDNTDISLGVYYNF